MVKVSSWSNGFSYHIVPAYVMFNKFHLFYRNKLWHHQELVWMMRMHSAMSVASSASKETAQNWRFLQESLFCIFQSQAWWSGQTIGTALRFNTCKDHIRQCSNRKRKSLVFGIPRILRAPSNHHDDCYFCIVSKVHGFNKKNHNNYTVSISSICNMTINSWWAYSSSYLQKFIRRKWLRISCRQPQFQWIRN